MTNNAQEVQKGNRPIVLIDEEERQEEATETSPLVGASNGNDATEDNGGRKRQEIWIGYEDFIGLPWYRRPSVYWLLGPYFLFTLAFGGVIVPKLNLIVDLICRNYFSERQTLDPNFTFLPVVMGGDNPQCNDPRVQKNVAAFTLVISALTGSLSALTAPKLGSLSDRYGRKRLMVMASCGGLVNEVVTILAAKFPDTVSYHWLILGAFFDGITGSFTAGSILANSYSSDCAPPSKRGVHIGYLHACLFTGLAFGPLLAGYFVEWTGSLLSIFYVVLGCHAFVILFFWFFLPDSISKKRQTAAREKHRAQNEATAMQLRSGIPSSVGNFVGPRVASYLDDHMGTWLPAVLSANPFAPLKMLVPSGRDNSRLRRNLVLLALIDSVVLSSSMGANIVIVLYSEYMFDWGTLQASRFVSAVSMVRVVILLCILPVINYIFRIRPLRRQQRESGDAVMVEKNSGADNLDVWILRVALFSDAIGAFGYIFVRREELFILCGLATAFGGLASATIQSAITKHVPAERVGSLLGAIGLLHALGRVFAPALFNGLYAGTVETFPQAFFVLLASLFGLVVLASFFVRPHIYMKEDGYVAVPSQVPNDARTPDITADEEVLGL
ncbi:MFS general substrate transporter [Annulohypoxylon maeteangense]|uniref:MFS general substrate transporter n=1 Tax=Annulohypoxylon maeteangense TaxID=1927788 RepID=UPI00200781BA|nr:MFS general substrate transporter [Annulohypoxylon maeteangense]KAI0890365.1 MFS general substrate transporter [Annulohypoxylon maeteangense]